MRPHQSQFIPLNQSSPEIAALHAAFCEASGQELKILPAHEFWWKCAQDDGISPEDVRMWIAHMVKENLKREPRYRTQIKIRYLISTPEYRARLAEDVAEIKSRLRVKVMNPGRAEVMRATGRSDETITEEARHIRDVELIANLRKAAGA